MNKILSILVTLVAVSTALPAASALQDGSGTVGEGWTGTEIPTGSSKNDEIKGFGWLVKWNLEVTPSGDPVHIDKDPWSPYSDCNRDRKRDYERWPHFWSCYGQEKDERFRWHADSRDLAAGRGRCKFPLRFLCEILGIGRG